MPSFSSSAANAPGLRQRKAGPRRSRQDGGTTSHGLGTAGAMENLMSALRSILLHLDASPRSAARLRLARELAGLHGARVSALYAVTPSLYDLPFAMAEGSAEMLTVLRQLDADRRRSARALFDHSEPSAAPLLQWRELDNEPLIPGVVRHAFCNDLLVLGQHDAEDTAALGIPVDFIPSVLIGSGRPALVIPYADICTTLGTAVLMAWKPTRESARALTAALPFLQHARQIHLTCEGDAGAAGGPSRDIEAYLRCHGVQAPLRAHAPVLDDAPGEGLLSLAADTGADLLVMGCYGHSRARELVLGGASRTVLKSMTLPVLMVH
jgi:nucleotide-binding universal stress UspA family protein